MCRGNTESAERVCRTREIRSGDSTCLPVSCWRNRVSSYSRVADITALMFVLVLNPPVRPVYPMRPRKSQAAVKTPLEAILYGDLVAKGSRRFWCWRLQAQRRSFQTTFGPDPSYPIPVLSPCTGGRPGLIICGFGHPGEGDSRLSPWGVCHACLT